MNAAFDRVAKAIDEELFKIQELGTGRGIITSDRLAGAIIAALREPTPEMVDAGRKTLPLGLDSDDMAKKWRAMIDAALK